MAKQRGLQAKLEGLPRKRTAEQEKAIRETVEWYASVVRSGEAPPTIRDVYDCLVSEIGPAVSESHFGLLVRKECKRN